MAPGVEVDEDAELLGRGELHQLDRVGQADLADREVELVGREGPDQRARVGRVEDQVEPPPAGGRGQLGAERPQLSRGEWLLEVLRHQQ